jgi:hypothetical protein
MQTQTANAETTKQSEMLSINTTYDCDSVVNVVGIVSRYAMTFSMNNLKPHDKQKFWPADSACPSACILAGACLF